MVVFPRTRLRRNRKSAWSRKIFAENNLAFSDLIMPLFVIEGNNREEEISMMPGIFRYTIDRLIEKIKALQAKGIRAIMLFPYIDQKLKDSTGSEALNRNNLICRAIYQIKRSVPDIGVIADVALDPYTSHGMDGILNSTDDVDNDRTIEILQTQALLLASAGADAIAPSDMMDGRIGIIRDALEKEKYHNTQIFSYSVKYNSSFYTPFRDAVGSGSNLGTRSKATYFNDYRNSSEAIKEVELDINEGADAVIIKPGVMYLDIISKVKTAFPTIPVIGYQVSGEYTTLLQAAKHSSIDIELAVIEVLTAFKRAGATAIITYFAQMEFNNTMNLIG